MTEFDRPARRGAYVEGMTSDRRARAVGWLLNHLRLPVRLASRLLSWSLGEKSVPYTAEQIASEEAAEAERSATG
jgi:hypothetical protein